MKVSKHFEDYIQFRMLWSHNFDIVSWLYHTFVLRAQDFLTTSQCTKINGLPQTLIFFHPLQPHPETSFTMIVTRFKRISGSLMNWHACISPMTCPFSVFLPPACSSAKVHLLGARKRSSFRIANALAKSRRPSRKVQKPILLHERKLISQFWIDKLA